MHMFADLNSEKDNPLQYHYMALVIKGHTKANTQYLEVCFPDTNKY